MAPAAGTGGGPSDACADAGHCYLPRWTPTEPVPDGRFGEATTMHGPWAAVGAPGADQVYLYRRSGQYWNLETILDSPHGPGASFGASVKLLGTVLVVGAPDDDLVGTDAGAVHVYDLTAGEFTWVESFTSPAPESGAAFGQAVTTGGKWVVVGEPDTSAGGRAVIYERQPDDSFGHYATIEHPGTDDFGRAVAVWGPHLIIADPRDDSMGSNAGAIRLYGLSGSGVSAPLKRYASDPQPYDYFGDSLAIDGERLVVGAYGVDEMEFTGGAAYVLAWDTYPVAPFFSYVEVEKLLPCVAQTSGYFGRSVAIHGDRIAVGAFGDDTGGVAGGKVYTFRDTGLFFENWTLEEQMRPLDGGLDDGFGAGVAVYDDAVLVGASGVDEVGNESGAAYLVSTTRDTWGGGECPCDALAGSQAFGAGKAGSVGVPELSIDYPLVPGESSLIKLRNVVEGATPILFWGFDEVSIGFDGGSVYTAGPFYEIMPTAGPLQQVGLLAKIGPDPAVCGQSLFLQALMVDPGAAGVFQTAQSNGLRLDLGY